MAETDWQKGLCKGLINKQFKRKYGVITKRGIARAQKIVAKPWKTKKQRQQWWNDLTPEQQAEQIEKWQAQKADKRRNGSIQKMARVKEKFDCGDCFHRWTRSCVDMMPNGCEYWFNPTSKLRPLRRHNAKYPWVTDGVNDENRVDWRAVINKKNPWLKVA